MSKSDGYNSSATIRDSIKRDPKVFAEVYELLKASQTPGDRLESLNACTNADLTTVSPLERLFEELPSMRRSVQLENYTRGRGVGEELDVLVSDQQDFLSDPVRLESIVKDIGRPALIIDGEDWQPASIPILQDRLMAARHQLRRCIPAVGRIDGQARMKGTGWLLQEDLLITNAHVAKTFLTASSNKLSFTFDEDVHFDNRNLPDVRAAHQARVSELLSFLADDVDIAVFKLKWLDRPKFEPLELDLASYDMEWDIAAIGYPADDGRDRSMALLSYFQKKFETKRLSPGRLLRIDDELSFQHDCTTLGGSSGSPIISLSSGKVVGLHYAGNTGEANRAIKSGPLQQAIKRLSR